MHISSISIRSKEQRKQDISLVVELLDQLKISDPTKYNSILDEYRLELEAINFIPTILH